MRKVSKQHILGSAFLLLGVLSNISFHKSVWWLPCQDCHCSANVHDLVKTHERHCMFVISKLYGNPEQYRRDAAMRWYREVTLASIKKASAFSDSFGVFSAAVLQASNSFSFIAKELDERERVIVEASVQEIDARIHELIRTKNCEVISLLRLDGDDAVTPVAFENIRHGWDEKCGAMNNSIDCILHTGPYRLPKVFLYPYIPYTGYIPCSFIDYSMTSMNAMSQGLGLTLSIDVWLRYFGGTSRAIFLDQHLHVWRNLLNMTRYTEHELKNNPVLNHGVWLITSLSSHFYHDASDLEVIMCTPDYLAKYLGYAVSETLWSARYSIPNLTKAQWAQNKFVKAKGADITPLPTKASSF